MKTPVIFDLGNADKTRMDVERTALAWTRTSLAFAGFAIVGYRTALAPTWVLLLSMVLGVASMVRALLY